MDNNKANTAQAKEKMNNMKHEVASQLGINLKQGYNGDLSSREAGYIGGYMVKKMIEDVERQHSGR
ncbi:MAG: alpha/beta-type small acid-soluble spore protein [Christensenellaceae bacterium]|nr:alpha/beta-type small acid-soluble spore protein [Christensenellaceae bacterium]